MRTGKAVVAAVVVGLLLSSGAALAQPQAPARPPACDPAKTPAKVEGQVVKVDPSQNRVTVRASDGTVHEFQASKESIGDFKVGDQIEAKLRSAPNC